MAPLYVFDTNSIRVLGNYYPQRFPSFWRRFEKATQDGLILSVREVYNELERQVTGWLWDWVRAHRDLFPVPTSQELEFVSEIFKIPHFQALVGTKQRLTGQPVADPFVIAAARARAACVVTEEATKPNAARIPNVCQHFGIPFRNMEGFLEQNGWEF
ncbi:MAG TPA: DUF4411 family protein [Thermodesulfobacteriota bacterium]